MKAPGERLYGHNLSPSSSNTVTQPSERPFTRFQHNPLEFDIYQEKVKTFKEIGFH